MMIYILKIETCDSSRLNLYKKNEDYFYDTFLTLDEALEKGKSIFKYMVQEFYLGERYNFAIEEEYKKTSIEELEKMVIELQLKYTFCVEERDLEYAKKFRLIHSSINDLEVECKGLEPTSKKYYYDFKGKLQYTEFEWNDSLNNHFYCARKYPNYDERKNNKFNLGEFVELKEKNGLTKEIFIVIGLFNNDWFDFGVNKYLLLSVEECGKIHTTIEYEFNIQKCNKVIYEKSVLCLLQKCFNGEWQISEEMKDKIKDGKIIFNDLPSWRDIEGLKEFQGFVWSY